MQHRHWRYIDSKPAMMMARAATMEKAGGRVVEEDERTQPVKLVSAAGQATLLKVALRNVRQVFGCRRLYGHTLDMMHLETSQTAIDSLPANSLADCRSRLWS